MSNPSYQNKYFASKIAETLGPIHSAPIDLRTKFQHQDRDHSPPQKNSLQKMHFHSQVEDLSEIRAKNSTLMNMSPKKYELLVNSTFIDRNQNSKQAPKRAKPEPRRGNFMQQKEEKSRSPLSRKAKMEDLQVKIQQSKNYDHFKQPKSKSPLHLESNKQRLESSKEREKVRQKFQREHFQKKQRVFYERPVQNKSELKPDDQLKSKLTSLYAKLRQEIQNSKESQLRIQQLQSQLAEAKNQKKLLEQRNSKLRMELKQAESSSSNYNEVVFQRDQLKMQLEQLREKLIEQIGIRKRSQSNLRSRDEQFKDYRERVTASEDKKNQQKSYLNEEVQKLRLQLMTKTKILADREDVLRNLKEEKERLNQQVSKFQRQSKQDKLKIQHMLQQHSNMYKQLQNTRRKIYPSNGREKSPMKMDSYEPTDRERLQQEKKRLSEELQRVKGKRQSVEQKKIRMNLQRRLEQIQLQLEKKKR